MSTVFPPFNEEKETTLQSKMEPTPFTERSNPITAEIDLSSPMQMVQLLGDVDSEIFTFAEGMFSEKVLNSISDVTCLIRETLLKHSPDDVAIVLSGCGTSGRLAYLLSRVCNNLSETLLGGRPFHYSIAGGDKSILTSQEAPEDDPKAGVDSLLKICRNKKKVIYIGITCGISAPFVGGQLDYCLRNLDVYTPILLGFNSVSMARNVTIPNFEKTMRTVAQDMEDYSKVGKAHIINPILGGEAITGSSRMKGGSATKIILETIFLSALNALECKNKPVNDDKEIPSLLRIYQDVCRKFYDSNAKEVMAEAITKCGDALKSGDKVRYLASGWTGVLPLIDSTECPPTFGSSVNDVRGFVHDGYKFLGIQDFGKEHGYFQLGFKDFVDIYKSTTVMKDAVFAFIQSPNDPILDSLRNTDLGVTLNRLRGNIKIFAIILEKTEYSKINSEDIDCFFDSIFRVKLPNYSEDEYLSQWSVKCRKAFQESVYGCCLKWLVNSISTGGHVLLGKVFKNYMCDVKVSNNKLYYRAIKIIQICSGASYSTAEKSLLKSIYETDDVTDDVHRNPVSEHNKIATPKDKVVPLAVILAKLKCTVNTAKEKLGRHTVLRNAILEFSS